MSRPKDTDYLSVSARLRAMENRLIDREKTERMLEAPTDEEARKVLTECGYADQIPLEEALRRRRAELYGELKKAVPDVRLVELFQIKYDYHNIKAILKAWSRGVAADDLLLEGGRYDAGMLQSQWQQSQQMEIPEPGRQAVGRAAALLREKDPQGADLVLDAACYAEMHALTDALKSDFLRGYVRLLTDAANLRTAVRAARCGGDTTLLAKALLPGGSVSAYTLQTAEPAKLAEIFCAGPLSRAAELGAAAATPAGGSLTAFEKACDDAVTAYLAAARRVPLGEQTVVGYLYAVEQEIIAVRTVFAGRHAGLDAEVIGSRLRNSYG